MEIKTAHRLRNGYSFNPENTISSAMDDPNIRALETDIQVTKDGVFVLMNYATIDKVTTLFDPSKNKISDYTYDELCRMNFHANVSEIEKVIATSAAEFGDRATEYLEYYKELYSDLRYSKIATLEQLLSLPRHGKHLFIEIKTNYSKEEKVKVLHILKI